MLKELLNNKLALVSMEGWKEQVTVLFRNINCFNFCACLCFVLISEEG